ncbi:hypothetical protein GA0115243_10271, partial [Streptomyces sp. ScaeMP-e83]
MAISDHPIDSPSAPRNPSGAPAHTSATSCTGPSSTAATGGSAHTSAPATTAARRR